MTQKAFQEFLGLKALIKSISSRDVLVKSEFKCEWAIFFFFFTYILAPGVGVGQSSDILAGLFFPLSFSLHFCCFPSLPSFLRFFFFFVNK